TAPRDGHYLEVIGHYDPRNGRATTSLKKERLLFWLSHGALPTDTVRSIIKEAGLDRPQQKK
ncbi:MAG: 30S ribosomal protein S16, partial [Deltaproteobacteria bacterium]|nr:30S ribosomal protein S16 [Deltaproteobacteria bacterium]